MTKQPLRVLDLFSGIGGFSLGLERAGMRTVRFVEINAYCRAVLKKHWPEIPCDEDIVTAEFTEGEADVICGGFPCQDISNAGNRAGIAGERSGLWREFMRAILLVQPLYAILENVAAILGRGVGVVLGDLAEGGYDAEWDCIPALAVGAPHERDRWWAIAYPAQMHGDDHGDKQRRRAAQISKLRNDHRASIPANAGQERVQRVFPQEVQRVSEFSWCENVRRLEDLRGRSDLPPPIFRGASDGIPHWVDRVGACGNSVVPAIPELLGRAIVASFNTVQALENSK